MRLWPFHRRHQEQGEDLDDALRQADRAIEDAQAQRQWADDLSGRLADTRGRNHFAQAVADRFQGKTT